MTNEHYDRPSSTFPVRCRCRHDTADPERGCECGWAEAAHLLWAADERAEAAWAAWAAEDGLRAAAERAEEELWAAAERCR